MINKIIVVIFSKSKLFFLTYDMKHDNLSAGIRLTAVVYQLSEQQFYLLCQCYVTSNK